MQTAIQAMNTEINAPQILANIVKELMDLVEQKEINSYSLNDKKFSPIEGNVSAVRNFTIQIDIFSLNLGLPMQDKKRFFEHKDFSEETLNRLWNIHEQLFMLNNVFYAQIPMRDGEFNTSHTYFYSHEMNNSLENWDWEETKKWKILPDLLQDLVEFPATV